MSHDPYQLSEDHRRVLNRVASGDTKFDLANQRKHQPDATPNDLSADIQILLDLVDCGLVGFVKPHVNGRPGPRYDLALILNGLTNAGRLALHRVSEPDAPRQGGESGTTSASLAATGPSQQHTDDGKYRRARWFKKGAAQWLRQAASPKRKGDKVRKRDENGTVVYHVGDVERLRPDLLPPSPSP